MNLRWKLLAAAVVAAAAGVVPASAQSIVPAPVAAATQSASCTLTKTPTAPAQVAMAFRNDTAVSAVHACWLQTGAKFGDGGEVAGSRTTCSGGGSGEGVDNKCTVAVQFTPPAGDLHYCVRLDWLDTNVNHHFYASCTRVVRDGTLDKAGFTVTITVRIGNGRPVAWVSLPVVPSVQRLLARPSGIAEVDGQVKAGVAVLNRTIRTVGELVGVEGP